MCVLMSVPPSSLVPRLKAALGLEGRPHSLAVQGHTTLIQVQHSVRHAGSQRSLSVADPNGWSGSPHRVLWTAN